MSILIKIAFRNVTLNLKKSLLLGITIFFSSFLLLTTNAAMNGVEQQVLKGYVNIQSGHIAVMWDSLKNTDHGDTQRFINVYESLSFDPDKDSDNKVAISTLNSFIEQNKNDIKAYFPAIRRNAKLQLDGKLDGAFILYSLSPESRDFMIDSKTLAMKEGEILSNDEDGICISQEKASANKLEIGDKIDVEVVTAKNKLASKTFTIRGIYANGAFYDNYYGFLSEKSARQLFDIEDNYFDIGRIYLNDSSKASALAENLDKQLTADSKVLRAESYMDANTFYTNNPKNMKMMFSIFIFFLLIIIAIGLRSTVRMNLFERMKEFGTIRAIGFSRGQSYLVILFEVFFLALMALAIAFVFAAVLVLIFGSSGIYVGPAVSSMFGGERFYPHMKAMDIVLTIVVMLFFSLMSTLNPGLRLCYQKIVDIMEKRQKRVFPFILMIKEIGSGMRGKAKAKGI